jgi:DoxX-like family
MNVRSRGFAIAYWVTTILIASEMALGGAWDLLRITYVRSVIEHLGYPNYFLLIIGVWKIPCAVALVAPRFPRLKEWAYAGAFFNYTGAVASHLAVGDGVSKWLGPLAFAAITLASWALRPPNRRLQSNVSLKSLEQKESDQE